LVALHQFDIVKNPNPATARDFPYFCILQCDFMADMDTVLVAPLRPVSAKIPIKLRINIAVEIDKMPHFVLMEYLSPALRKDLKTKVATVAAQRDEFIRAADALFTGL
jgi:hypothetical protein